MSRIDRRSFVRGAAAGAAALSLSRFPTPALAQAAAVKVGAVLELSGFLELFGRQARIGLDLAAAEINAGGGIGGRKLELIYEDNKTDPKTAADRTRKLVQQDGAIAVAGPIASNSRVAMIPALQREKRLLLYATNYEGADENGQGCGPSLFFFNTVPNQDVGPLMEHIDRQKLGSSFYMFGANYNWPRNMFAAAKDVMKKTGAKAVGEDYTPFGVADFTSTIRKIADSGADVLLFALPGTDGITFIKQAEEFGLLKKVRIAFLGFAETYLGAFGPGKAEDMLVCVPFVSTADEPAVKEFVARVRKQTPDAPGVSHYVMTHYNALMALKAGLEKAGGFDAEAGATGMAGLAMAIPTGEMRITPADHHVALPMYIGRTEGGALKVVEKLGVIDPVSGCKV